MNQHTIECRDENDKTWTPAEIVDLLRNGSYKLRLFPNATPATVPANKLRPAHRPTTNKPKAAELRPETPVEVRLDDSDVWAEATVIMVKGGFVSVRLAASGNEKIVSTSGTAQLRLPPSDADAHMPKCVKQTIPLTDEKVLAWFLQNQERIVEDVLKKSGLILLRIEESHKRISMIGEERSLSTAKMLIELHGRHINEMKRMTTEREALANKLQSERAKEATGCRLEFDIARELIGLVVGKNGSKLREAQNTAGIDSITINQGPSVPRVEIRGSTMEACEKMRDRLEFVIESVPVRDDQLGWLIGKQGRNLKEMQDKTKVVRANVDDRNKCLILVGTRTAVDAAKLYVGTHLDYLTDYNAQQQEIERTRRELYGVSLDGAARSGGGRAAGGRAAGGGGGGNRRSGGAQREPQVREPSKRAPASTESAPARQPPQEESGKSRGGGRKRGGNGVPTAADAATTTTTTNSSSNGSGRSRRGRAATPAPSSAQ